MSIIKVRSIQHDEATTDAIQLDNAGNVTLPTSLTVNGTNIGTSVSTLNTDMTAVQNVVKADRLDVPNSTTNPSSPSSGALYFNSDTGSLRLYNSSLNDWIGVGVKLWSYARYRQVSTTSHHPRVSRLYVIDSNGNKLQVQSYTSDNCADSGGIPSDGNTFTYNSTSLPREFTGIGGYVVYGGGYRSATIALDVSDDNSTWTTLGTVLFEASSCGEKDFYV